MATESDFDNINESGNAFMPGQWRYIARAVKGLKTLFTGGSFLLQAGTENKALASDLLSGFTTGTIYVSPEASTTDDLIGIVPPTGLSNGTYITLRLLNTAHTITLKHNSGSTIYKLQLAGGIDTYLNNTTQAITFMLKDNQWYQHTAIGREDENNVGTLGLYQNGFANSSNGLRFTVLSNNTLFLYGRCDSSTINLASTIFTLPVGFRPLDVQFRVNAVASIGGTSYPVFLLISGSSGNVTITKYGGITYPSDPVSPELHICALIPNIGR